jgi:hypothetical protein
MTEPWKECVAWARENHWEENDTTRRLLELVDEDFAVKIWEQHREHSIDWLYGTKRKETYTPLERLKAFLREGRYVPPIEKLKTAEGREEIMSSLCNPWTN